MKFDLSQVVGLAASGEVPGLPILLHDSGGQSGMRTH